MTDRPGISVRLIPYWTREQRPHFSHTYYRDEHTQEEINSKYRALVAWANDYGYQFKWITFTGNQIADSLSRFD